SASLSLVENDPLCTTLPDGVGSGWGGWLFVNTGSSLNDCLGWFEQSTPPPFSPTVLFFLIFFHSVELLPTDRSSPLSLRVEKWFFCGYFGPPLSFFGYVLLFSFPPLSP